ncbi:NADP-dependent oxidoreductase [Actinacidiphila sp. ITFR-21]|uniref:NADP-dependent oxidoreductase n=1 Tax=Actinacidiphila sp. ITFR-21 TaxID=3075199 RepID=UPI0028896D19|nr:NADP-dependent oxidoreductase [Streptomyces sp. ITFR-21]WNI14229.1 NADP-dependent oxidoreductase [Streptomyces sp. ITFR-21]
MVRAVVATAWSGADTVSVQDVPSRPAGPDEVVVAVRATAISPFDLKRARGVFGRDTALLPLRLGNEAAGVVTAAGSRAAGFDGLPVRVGEEVFGHWLPGAQAGELTLPAGVLLHKPPALGFAEAAALLGSATTAAHALDAVAVGAGDTVLVHGAAGSVGNMTARLALLRGAAVVGTAAPGRHGRLRAEGVEPVSYGEGLAERVRAAAPGGVTAAVDTVGTAEALDVSFALVPDPARVVTMVDARTAADRGGQAIGPGPETERVRTAARLDLTRLAARGDLPVPVAHLFALEDARSAYRTLAAGHAGGKIVLIP